MLESTRRGDGSPAYGGRRLVAPFPKDRYMRKRFFLVLVALALVLQTQARAVGFESITVADSAIGITAAIYADAQACMARLETAQIRFRFDGTNPSSAEGMLLEVGEVLTIDNQSHARTMRFIRTGSTSGVLKVTCW